MYYDYFGLKQAPFKITPDTTLFYPGGKRGEILDALVYAVTAGEGIVKVVGEVGSGKTMLCRMLQQELPGNIEIVYLANPSLGPEDILHAIAFELNLPVASGASRLQVMNNLQQYLLQKHGAGQQVVVFVEEAQSMPLATLEEMRFLSNLETQQNKLLQIILFGQPELDVKIARREIRQLKERITYSFCLNPFQINDVRDYLNSRLRACGNRSGELFSNGAIREIGKYSRGLVRRINILADKSMLAAYAANQHKISVQHVRQAARDSDFTRSNRLFLGAASICLVLFTGTGVVYWNYGGSNEKNTVRTNSAIQMNSAVPQSPAPVEDAGPGHGDPYMTAPGPVAQHIIAAEINNGHEALLPDHQAAEPQADEPQAMATSADITERLKLGGFYAVREQADTPLSDQELLVLKHWYENLPGEVTAQFGQLPETESCRLCWAIIYRPLITP
jgi:type II secretory pathway predicted ATPase ExeA